MFPLKPPKGPARLPSPSSHVRRVEFRTLEDKAAWLDSAASLDVLNPKVRDVGIRFARAAGPNDYEGLANQLYSFVRNSITYVNDPSSEEFADSATILARGADDCDGKARLFVALCRSVGAETGLRARIVPVFKHYPNGHPDEFVHVLAECTYPGAERHPFVRPDGWILCELIVRDIAMGQKAEDAPRDPSLGRRALR